MKIENIYTSIACNRTPESADWGNNGQIVFAACNSIAIFNPKLNNTAKITNTFIQHTKRVTTVKWIAKSPNATETEFISGSDDGLAILWDISNPSQVTTKVLKGHESGINFLDGVYVNGKLTIATASTDSSIKLWSLNEESKEFECNQTILLKSGFCFAIRITPLPGSQQLLLAFSSDDDSISLWSNPNGSSMEKIHQLIGHEDWVRGLDFVTTEDGDLLLASSSQDNFIRLWRISPRTQEQVSQNEIDILNISDGEIRVEEKIIQVAKSGNSQYFAVSLESVLYGHEGWVYGVHWHSSDLGLRLLSASIDKSIIIWQPTDDGVWMEKVRVGGVGGNSLGFFGGKFASDGKSILGFSFQGGFHIWKQSNENESIWTPTTIIGGHFGEVRDLGWEPKGAFLLTVSADQTTRLHAPWVRSDDEEHTWHELARPQVHGYDMQAIAVLSRYKFASGAEEKIVRTFQATGNFVENFQRITNTTDDKEGNAILESLPKGASVPSLGLSNKAVFSVDESPQQKHVKDEYPENYFVPVTLITPPQEETLMQNTLWPEVQKLYGHGFEIYALASSPDGQVLASSCRATNAEHAQIILWNTSTWKQVQKLSSHQLTVTQLKFSPNNKYLLSVSRDRRLSVFENKSTFESISFEMVATTDKTNGIHTRIIWSCDWSHDSQYFVTSSRDGKIVVWTKASSVSDTSLRDWHSVNTLELKNESVTAVAFADKFHNDKAGHYILAMGFESGVIQVCGFNGSRLEKIGRIEQRDAHHLTVRKLQFKPQANGIELASCGDDHLVRIYKICD
ncbi:elongator complex protein 2 [Episyrphus balteatus]|uniref:elongator complex protein 2 n=1 Tax=Episyrphus balteatus TaxID=286459 RepID=UPI002486C2F7|nr:elongator complex protein 2 [Episyrphus balteatus]